jgi:Transposase
VEYVGIDGGCRRAAWCALGGAGRVVGEGAVAADENGLGRLVILRGVEVRAVVVMVSAAIWVRDTLAGSGWRVRIAHAGKVGDVAPLACKTDRVEARVLAELCRRDLVSELWGPSLGDRELRERLRRRTHLVRMRASAMHRIFGLLTRWGLRMSLRWLREPDAMELLARRGVPEVWRRSIAEALGGDRVARRADRADRPRARPAGPRRCSRGAAGHHPGRRRSACTGSTGGGRTAARACWSATRTICWPCATPGRRPNARSPR